PPDWRSCCSKKLLASKALAGAATPASTESASSADTMALMIVSILFWEQLAQPCRRAVSDMVIAAGARRGSHAAVTKGDRKCLRACALEAEPQGPTEHFPQGRGVAPRATAVKVCAAIGSGA